MNLFQVLAEYDALVRENDSVEFPALQNVADCKDGYMGAFGELLELMVEDYELTGAEYEALEGLFFAYQQALRVELFGAAG